jgi:transcriptional regulator with XRE-family HTH domain
MVVKRKISRQRGQGNLQKAAGRRLRELRGFDSTQQEFAAQIGVSQGQLSKYERGIAFPPADVLIKIRSKFGVSIDWLLAGKV